jgi:hypothetical protein
MGLIRMRDSGVTLRYKIEDFLCLFSVVATLIHRLIFFLVSCQLSFFLNRHHAPNVNRFVCPGTAGCGRVQALGSRYVVLCLQNHIQKTQQNWQSALQASPIVGPPTLVTSGLRHCTRVPSSPTTARPSHRMARLQRVTQWCKGGYLNTIVDCEVPPFRGMSDRRLMMSCTSKGTNRPHTVRDASSVTY